MLVPSPLNVLALLPGEFYCDWNHKQYDLKQGGELHRDAIPINSDVTIHRDFKLLPLITEETGNRVVKVLIGITFERKNSVKFKNRIDIDVRLYDKEKMKIIGQNDKQFKFEEYTDAGNFELVLASYNKIEDVKTDELQIRISTEIYFYDDRDEFVFVHINHL